MRAVVVLMLLAAGDLSLTIHAIVTRHVPSRPALATTEPGTGTPRVADIHEVLGCVTSFLLLLAAAVVIIDAWWMSRRCGRDTGPKMVGI
jgi:uncharacterized membrane protein